MNDCIRITDLNFNYKKDQILKNINLSVPYKSIYGFLGPNGAGKTTTLKLLLGLLKLQEGKIEVFNKNLKDHRIEILGNIGSIIETPSLYGHLTAYENLEIYSTIYGISPIKINELIHTVGLNDAGKKKTNQFSLGMKQRLSLAISMLNDPELLILDEPTNGLDPSGIIEIRNLIKALVNDHGKTVLVSSHILSEIEKLCTHVAIINKGEIVLSGEMETLKRSNLNNNLIFFRTNNQELAYRLISKINLNVSIKDEFICVEPQGNDDVLKINLQLAQNGVIVQEIFKGTQDLESIFNQFTQNEKSQINK